MQQEINKWIKQANHDFDMAKAIFDEGGYDTCAFLCQQSAEKHLKALYIHRNMKSPPKIHYLDELGKILKCPKELLDLLKELSADYMITRYPDVTSGAPFEEYSKEDAEKRIKSAETITKWIKGQLK